MEQSAEAGGTAEAVVQLHNSRRIGFEVALRIHRCARVCALERDIVFADVDACCECVRARQHDDRSAVSRKSSERGDERCFVISCEVCVRAGRPNGDDVVASCDDLQVECVEPRFMARQKCLDRRSLPPIETDDVGNLPHQRAVQHALILDPVLRTVGVAVVRAVAPLVGGRVGSCDIAFEVEGAQVGVAGDGCATPNDLRERHPLGADRVGRNVDQDFPSRSRAGRDIAGEFDRAAGRLISIPERTVLESVICEIE